MLSYIPYQFSTQDVMVPWHMQPKYATRQQQQQYSRVSKPKKQRKRKRKEKRKLHEEEGASVELTTTVQSHDVPGEDALLGELAVLCLSEEEQCGEEKAEDCGHHHCYKATLPKEPGPSHGCSFSQQHSGDEQADSTPTSEVTSNPHLNAMTSREKELGGNQSTATSFSDQKATSSAPSLEEQGYQTFQRYYHVFKKGELTQLLARVPGVTVMEEFYDHENWCVLAEKTTVK